uniref:Uncharacterized protein n=2 Tax=Biomphalaria glabrata TaxID=6526 RepID=A0A2C9LMQ2_BIOGL
MYKTLVKEHRTGCYEDQTEQGLKTKGMCQPPPIIYAVIKGDLPKVKSLIAQGHSVNVTDEKGATALHWSCSKDDERLCDYLLEVGCNVKAKIQNGSTALHVASDHGCIGCARVLIKRGAELDTPNDRCDTPLHAAAHRGHLDIIKLLVQAGANPMVSNKHGMTPLAEASAKSFDTCVQFLLPYTNNLLSSEEKESQKYKNRQNEEQTSSFNIQPESTYYKPVNNVIDNSPLNKKNVTNSSGYLSEKLSKHDLPSCPSSVLSIDSDYSSYTSDRDVTPFNEMTMPSVGYISTFDSLLNKAVVVASQVGSPVRSSMVERHSERLGHTLPESAVPPELPPRPSWLCKPELVPRISSCRNVLSYTTGRENNTKTLVGLEVHQFIEQLQERMLAMQEQLARYETSNNHLRTQVEHLTKENKSLKTENEQLKRQQFMAQPTQCNPQYQCFSDIDEGMHSGSYWMTQTHDKLNRLNSIEYNSIYGSLGSREPVESNELA